jgi:hypothetical protein
VRPRHREAMTLQRGSRRGLAGGKMACVPLTVPHQQLDWTWCPERLTPSPFRRRELLCSISLSRSTRKFNVNPSISDPSDIQRDARPISDLVFRPERQPGPYASQRLPTFEAWHWASTPDEQFAQSPRDAGRSLPTSPHSAEHVQPGPESTVEPPRFPSW